MGSSHHTATTVYTMAPVMATGRLRKELIKLQKEPLPGVIAEPKESDILV
jgi:hypothetical protein